MCVCMRCIFLTIMLFIILVLFPHDLCKKRAAKYSYQILLDSWGMCAGTKSCEVHLTLYCSCLSLGSCSKVVKYVQKVFWSAGTSSFAGIISRVIGKLTAGCCSTRYSCRVSRAGYGITDFINYDTVLHYCYGERLPVYFCQFYTLLLL